MTSSEGRSTQRPDRQKSSVVTSMKVSDENGSLVRSLTLTSNNTMVTERIQIDRVVTETVSQPLHRDTGVPMDEECVISVQEDPNFHLEYYSRFTTNRLQLPWALPVDIVS